MIPGIGEVIIQEYYSRTGEKKWVEEWNCLLSGVGYVGWDLMAASLTCLTAEQLALLTWA